MPGRKRPPAESAAATGGTADQTNSATPANGSKTGARSTAQRPSRTRSQTTKAKAGAAAGNGNGMTPNTTVTEPIVAPTPDRERAIPEAEIRARAYEIYQSRGGADGDPVADWLAAERQVLGKGNEQS